MPALGWCGKMDQEKTRKEAERLGAWLLLPFFLIRFGLMTLLDRQAVGRAAHFAPMRGGERAAYWVYQLSNIAILLLILFARIQTAPSLLLLGGVVLYSAGLVLLALAVAAFVAPAARGVQRTGVYRFSRNPMYGAYFLCFLGCALLVRSPLLAVLVLVFQISAHWVILAEERWCVQQFGEVYLQYMRTVRRYWGQPAKFPPEEST